VAAAIRAAWAGWEVVEEQHGLLGQLRAAGVEAPEELPSERPPPPLTWELPPLQAARRPGFEFG
jgi:hypothetical protein